MLFASDYCQFYFIYKILYSKREYSKDKLHHNVKMAFVDGSPLEKVSVKMMSQEEGSYLNEIQPLSYLISFCIIQY